MRTKLIGLLNVAVRHSLQNHRHISTKYASAISLNNLHPQSSLNLAVTVKPPLGNNEQFNGYIPIEKLDITYSRSTGPGGQNVNKVNTKVDVRFQLQSAEWLDEETKALLAQKHPGRLNKDGYFIVRSDKTRSQIYNQADAITKLREIIFEAIESSKVTEPSEETLHMLRKRKDKANMDRLARKKGHSLKKAARQAPEF